MRPIGWCRMTVSAFPAFIICRQKLWCTKIRGQPLPAFLSHSLYFYYSLNSMSRFVYDVDEDVAVQRQYVMQVTPSFHSFIECM